jgi:hypothetical protein
MSFAPEDSYDLFLAVPMSSFRPEEYRALRSELLAAIERWKSRARTLRIFCAMEGIAEPINFDDPEKGRQMDHHAVRSSRHFAAIYPGSINSGMTFEAGIAYAHGIPMTLFCRDKKDLVFIMRKMPGTIIYKDISDIIPVLEKIMLPCSVTPASDIRFGLS